MSLRTVTKVSIFLGILMVDLVFFTAIRQFFPEGYEWIIATISYHAQISLEVTRSLFVIGGFVIGLICVPVILHCIYNTLKTREGGDTEYVTSNKAGNQ
jgi:hypothetical protein